MDKECPHGCGLDWHSAAVTHRVKKMFENHRFDADYDPEQDDTSIHCVGSEFYGPPRFADPFQWTQDMMSIQKYGILQQQSGDAHGYQNMTFIKDEAAYPGNPYGPKSPAWLQDILDWSTATLTITPTFSVWLPGDDPPPPKCEDAPIEFGPDNWINKELPQHPHGYTKDAAKASKEIMKYEDYLPVPDSPWNLSEYIDQVITDINDSYPKVKQP